MKLKNKLFMQFTILFMFLLNIFGLTLLQSIFNSNMQKAIDTSFQQFSMVYINMQSGENLSRLYFTDREIIEMKNSSYLLNSQNRNMDIQVYDASQNLLYTSSKKMMKSDDLFKDTKHKQASYKIDDYKEGRGIFINQKVTFGNSTYYLTVISSIEDVYDERYRHILLLLIFDIISGICTAIVIYLFSKKLTNPLFQLIENIRQVQQGKYDHTLAYVSNIYELNVLTDNFNDMSALIKDKIDLLEQNNKEKQRFIDSLTHEIRTPLTSIIGYSSLFLNKDIQDQQLVQQSFQDIYKNGKRIEMLTSTLIKLITLDKQILETSDIEIYAAINEILRNYRQQEQYKEIDFILKGEGTFCCVDVNLFEILITNIINNATKAVGNCDKKIIEVCVTKNIVKISDTGIGISEEDIEKIFEPFFMADTSRKNTISTGFGLGLSICYQIMQLLEIDFNIESKQNVGTIITLTFKESIYEDK